MRRSIAVVLALLITALWSSSAAAVTKTVDATSSRLFDPATVRIPEGGTVKWHNTAGFTHTTTQDSPLSLWNKSLDAGQSKSVEMDFAGRFLYHCEIHGGNGGVGMSGVVKVPVIASPSSGTTETAFTIQMAAVAPPDGFGFDIQRKIPGSTTWHPWKRNVAKASIPFTATEPGTYAFRVRFIKKADRSRHSAFSPGAAITVAAAG